MLLCCIQVAVVFDQPGITRDRMYTRTEWTGTEFVVVDTGVVCLYICLRVL